LVEIRLVVLEKKSYLMKKLAPDGRTDGRCAMAKALMAFGGLINNKLKVISNYLQVGIDLDLCL